MKTIKTLFFIYCVLLAFNTAAQQQVSIEEARRAASQTMNSRQSRGIAYDEARVKKVNTLKNKSENTLMYEVIFDDGQGVLLSGSKVCLPILGYFAFEEGQSIFDDDAPDGLKFMLEEYREQIELCFQNDTVRLHHQNQWQALQQEAGNSQKSAQEVTKASGTPTDTVVAPLLASRWGQSSPNAMSTYSTGDCDGYNYYAPIGNCSSCRTKKYAGCVAVAMAQIMYYWKYPVYTVSTYQYDWCNMVDSLNTDSPNYINERNAIARLIKDCGDAVDMDFGCSSSSSKIGKARKAFVNNFGFHEDADRQRKSWHSSSTWKSTIKSDLNKGRPVYYRGVDPEGGHAFVCDGYGSDDMFHFNWGWNGSWNSTWFTLDDLTPGYNFNSRQQAIFYLRPKNNQDYCNFTLPLWMHYYFFGGLPASLIHRIIPKVTILESVPSGQGYPASWYTIESGQTGEYVAHEAVYLKPGFHAKAGSNFMARIEPCNNCVGLTSSKVIYSEIEENEPEINVNEKDNIDKGNIDKYKDDTVVISPNPNEGNFIITLSGELEPNAAFEIYSENGKLLYKSAIIENNQNVIFTDNSGIYIIKIINGKKMYTDRFVLK